MLRPDERHATEFLLGGLRVRADRAIPHTVELPPGGEPDVLVHFGTLPPWTGTTRDAGHTPWLANPTRNSGESIIWGWRVASAGQRPDSYLVAYEECTAVIDGAGKEVWMTWHSGGTIRDAAVYLTGPILAFILRLRGTTCLHASAIVVGGQAVAFLGGQGCGKSTTVVALGRVGYPVLTDDVLVVAERPNGAGERHDVGVVPMDAPFKLWGDAAEFLFGVDAAPPRLSPEHPTWDKRGTSFAAAGLNVAQQPAPLGALYVLGARTDGPNAPAITEMSRRDGLLALLANSYAVRYASMREHAAALRTSARIAAVAPIRALTPHADPARLGAMCELVLADLARLGLDTTAPALVW